MCYYNWLWKKTWWKCNKGHVWASIVANRLKGSGCPYCSGQRVSVENSLSNINPELAKWWHPTKNGLLKPEEVTANSSKHVWWMCDKGHEFKGKVGNRARAKGCPYCMNKKLAPDNSLAARYPDCALEWHPTKNGLLTPEDVMPGNNKKAWWKGKCGHEWEAQILSRAINGRQCPYCAGQKVTPEMSLSAIKPRLIESWHPSKNGKLKPDQVMPGSDKIVWWKCDKGHEWKSGIGNRVRGTGCPYCSNNLLSAENNLLAKFPDLAFEWDNQLNELGPDQVIAGSSRKFHWVCKKGHKWKAVLSSRVTGNGCPHCHSNISKNELRIFTELVHFFPDTVMGKKINGLECDVLVPSLNLAIEYDGAYWHKKKHKNDLVKNKGLHEVGIKLIRVREVGLEKISELDIIHDKREDVIKTIKILLAQIMSECQISDGTKRKIKKYNSESSYINNDQFIQLWDRLPGPLPQDSLLIKVPEVAKSWHPKLNGSLTPDDVSISSNRIVWWRCDNGHNFETQVNARTRKGRGSGCPYCAGQKVSSDNNLQVKYPEIAKEWNFEKNDLGPSDFTSGSKKRVWWKCIRGHEWETVIKARTVTNGSGCPYCSGRYATPETSLASVMPELVSEWDYERNKILGIDPTTILPSINKKVWWNCDEGHEWEATPNSRTSRGTGCPYCSGRVASNTNNLLVRFPEVAKQWNFKKNVLNPDQVIAGSNKNVWWKCNKGHEWEAQIYRRTKGNNTCPYCSGRMENNK